MKVLTWLDHHETLGTPAVCVDVLGEFIGIQLDTTYSIIAMLLLCSYSAFVLALLLQTLGFNRLPQPLLLKWVLLITISKAGQTRLLVALVKLFYCYPSCMNAGELIYRYPSCMNAKEDNKTITDSLLASQGRLYFTLTSSSILRKTSLGESQL